MSWWPFFWGWSLSLLSLVCGWLVASQFSDVLSLILFAWGIERRGVKNLFCLQGVLGGKIVSWMTRLLRCFDGQFQWFLS